jgi:uncharacterized protein (DUF305 family)
MKKAAAAIIAVITIALSTASCSKHSTSSGTTKSPKTSMTMALPSGVNDADVTFAQSMIPHHQQAVAMSATVLSDGADANVKDLAQRITDAQGPEIQTLTGWLKGWGRPVPSNNANGMDGMDGMSGTSGMDGMMSDSEMNSLSSVTGAELDALYLNLMIRHHQGALKMAEAEVANGQNPDAIALANSIITAQTNEITEMEALLPTLKSA